MPLGESKELQKLEAELQDPREAEHLPPAPLSWAAEAEEFLSPSSPSPSSSSRSSSSSSFALFLDTPEDGSAAGSPSAPQSPLSACPPPSAGAAAPWSLSEDLSGSAPEEEGSGPGLEPGAAPPPLQTTLHLKAAHLVAFLLLKYRSQQPTSQAEMLEVIGNDAQVAFPVILGQASQCMQLVFGVHVKEVDPGDHSYVLVPVLGLTCDGMLSGEQGMPKNGLLVYVLGVILVEDDRAPEEEVWEALAFVGVYAGQEHIIYGEPRELLTKVWVQEGYVEYRQVPGSDPARYEFLWGPRAHVETSQLQMEEYLLRVNPGQLASALALCEEAVRDEGEGA
ncbi:melanoma-associated antigen 8-like isoform X2 [Zalophus californianus]|nr:melanoma-associated antigen 8-like isoform X2 [Zalophus californianus]XP_035581290.1 melanoma-associated antigen 8-like isoform X2 [Zalophus californianus]XP_035581291.1 melanoma-associated antigen 8-like isoform X2 [Zalophus californianus]XP_035581292.1 melanoma-associated antigen 8-like isoform X2 [Zalophus californianus]XP_035581293.1 melanoma-associated antigen 8-like isoform X2 [Zalophus californianus]XP_035581294.1 melanoma-associated antigen 8-like isoform X2 [Zalophus californianus]